MTTKKQNTVPILLAVTPGRSNGWPLSRAAYRGVGAGGRRCSAEELADMEREAREMLADPRGETAAARHYDFPATVPSRHHRLGIRF